MILEAFVKGKTYLQDYDYTLYRTVGPSWDNTARSMSNAKILSNSSPELYQEWLENVIKYTKKNYSKIINLYFYILGMSGLRGRIWNLTENMVLHILKQR